MSKGKSIWKNRSGTNGEAWFIGLPKRDNKENIFAVYLRDNAKERVSSTLLKKLL